MAWLASPCLLGHAGLCHDGCHPAPSESIDIKKNKTNPEQKPHALIRWSIQEIRRIAQRLKQRRIEPAFVIVWSRWRRAHQAAAQKAHIKRKSRL
jgi:hypothetical protein